MTEEATNEATNENQNENMDEGNNQEAQHEEAPKTFTEEQLKEIINKEVEGLKSKNSELLGKLKEQQTAAEKAKEEALKKSGNTEELKQFYEKQYQAQIEELKQANEQLQQQGLQAKKEQVLGNLLGDFVDPVVARAVLDKMITVEDGNYSFKDFEGNIVADSAEGFKKWVHASPQMKYILQGNRSSGGGASGSGTGQAGHSVYKRSEWNKLDAATKMKVTREMASENKTMSEYIIED